MDRNSQKSLAPKIAKPGFLLFENLKEDRLVGADFTTPWIWKIIKKP